MRVRLLPIPFTLLFFLSCNPKPSASDSTLITIDIPGSIQNKGEVKLSEITSDIEFIQLETNKECLINAEKSECFITGHYILVISRKPVGVMLFDRKGKFIRRIGQVGKGPNEYVYIDAGCIDPRGRFIYLADPYANKIFKYSIAGEVLLQKPYNELSRFLDFGKMKMVFIDKDHIALTPMGKPKLADGFCRVLVLDANLTVTDSLLKIPDKEEIPVNIFFSEELAAAKGGVMLWKPYLGSVDFLYPDGRILQKYQLNLGGKKTLEENLKKPDEFEQPPVYLTMVRDLPDYLAIFGFSSTHEFVSMVYNKKTNQAYSIESSFNCPGFEQRKLQVFTDDLAGLPFLPMWEVNYFEKIMYCWYDIQENIDNLLVCIRDMKVLLPERRDELIRKIRARKEYDNPMLIVMMMKEK